MVVDRRIRKTQNSITIATIKLLTSTPISKLTIKEICSKADISRSTFYLHYNDASDVVEQLYSSIAKNISKVIDKFDFTSIITSPKPFLLQICEFLRGNLELYQLLMINDYNSNFRRRLKKLLEAKILEENAYRTRNRAEFEYSVCYTMSGLVETLCDNMSDINNENSEKLINTLAKHMSSGSIFQ